MNHDRPYYMIICDLRCNLFPFCNTGALWPHQSENWKLLVLLRSREPSCLSSKSHQFWCSKYKKQSSIWISFLLSWRPSKIVFGCGRTYFCTILQCIWCVPLELETWKSRGTLSSSGARERTDFVTYGAFRHHLTAVGASTWRLQHWYVSSPHQQLGTLRDR